MKASLGVSLFLVFTAASAEKGEIGQATAQWLELQKSGAAAAPEPRPLPGDVAQRNYQRYLRSFEREVPDAFQQGGVGQ